MRDRKLFVAGATGATGRTVVRLAPGRNAAIVPHRRPKPGRAPDPAWAEFPLDDHAKLVEAMRGCSTVAQLIGTMRKRFAAGDTYETSDIGTTRQLVAAAKEAGVDHLILLSSGGAGMGVGAYLKAKQAAETLVRESGIDWTILRPPAFDGEEHSVPGFLYSLGKVPGFGWARPIRMEELAAVVLHVAEKRAPLGAILESGSLWKVVAEATAGRTA